MRLTLPLLLLLLAAVSASAVAAPPTVPVGERHGVAHLPSAAVRDAGGRDALRYTVWYPATPEAREQPIVIGPPAAPLFTVGSAAADAGIASGRLPTLLLSHGNGGSARMMGWFGIAMARAGYLVIAVDHPGNNGIDPMTLAGSLLIWERAEDLKAALAAVQADPQLGPHVDARRVGVAGFSAGGFTALVAAGARVDLAHLIAFCRAQPDDGVCRPQLESPDTTLEARIAAAASPALAPYMARAADDHGIPGIGAVFLMAPAIVQAFPPDQLRKVRQPVSILAGDADQVAPPVTNAEVVAALSPSAGMRTAPEVGHYDFLATCTDAGRRAMPALCAGTVPREETHAAAILQATHLFDEALVPEGARSSR